MADPQPPPPGYPPAQNPGYPQEKQPVYPPEGYPPPQQPGYPEAQPGYPPQQQGYPPPSYPQPQQQSNTTVVVTQQPVAVPTPVFKDRPVIVMDSNGQQVQTVLQYRSGALTWLICCLICWVTGGCWILALVAFCINATKDVVHITPTDGKVVGVYKRL